MKQSDQLLSAYKKTLKHKGITYAALAEITNQSEANVKRIFATGNITLSKLEILCNAIGADMFELIKICEPFRPKITRFSEHQELELASNKKLLTLLYLLSAGVNKKSIFENYNFSVTEYKRFLLRLDKLDLIELHAKDRFQLKFDKNVSWIPGGPLEKKYKEAIIKEFLNSPFNGTLERIRMLNGRLSPSSIQVLSRQLQKFVEKFEELSALDAEESKQKTKAVSAVIAYRPWLFSLLAKR